MARVALVVALIGVALSAVVGAGACTPGSDVSRELGARCEAHEDCDDVCLFDPEFPDGFCSVDCEGPAACPARSTCVNVERGVCLRRCFDPGDCDFLGPGWQCVSTESLPVGNPVNVCRGP